MRHFRFYGFACQREPALKPTASGLKLSASLRLIVVLNEKLLEVMGDDVTQEQAFAHANDVLKTPWAASATSSTSPAW